MSEELKQRTYRLEDSYEVKLETLRWLHKGNKTDAVRAAIDLYYDQDGERAEEIRRLVEGAADA